MLLHEEYSRRFCRQPLVSCPRYGYIVLENYQAHKWFFGMLRRVGIRNEPDAYTVSCFSLSHNGYRGGHFNKLSTTHHLAYDEYEDFMLEWAKELEKPKVVPKKDLMDKTWEMVLYCLDGWLADKTQLAEEVFKSVDSHLPKRERKKSMRFLTTYLWDEHSEILIWRDNVLNGYCDWIIKLI